MEKSINLGDENDEPLFDRLVKTLDDMGARHISSDRVMGGSQDLQILRVDIEEKVIVVEAETYIGLTVIGDDVLVDQIVSQMSLQ